MSIGTKTFGNAARLLRSRVVGGGLVLCYHRVGTRVNDAFELTVDTNNFANHVAVLRQHFCPLTLDDLVTRAWTGTLPRRAVALTFDDGYVDNLELAIPILERSEVPATFFIATGNPGAFFWWDELENSVWSTSSSASELRVQIRGKELSWQPTELDRAQIHRQLVDAAKTLPAEERRGLVEAVRDWSPSAPPAGIRAMNQEEMVRLADHPLATIGGHTKSHPRLSARPREEQYEEALTCRRYLSDLTGVPPLWFSYPFGRPGRDYNRTTIEAVRKAGFTKACALHEDTVRRSTRPFQIPRHFVANWTAEVFMRKLRRWLG